MNSKHYYCLCVFTETPSSCSVRAWPDVHFGNEIIGTTYYKHVSQIKAELLCADACKFEMRCSGVSLLEAPRPGVFTCTLYSREQVMHALSRNDTTMMTAVSYTKYCPQGIILSFDCIGKSFQIPINLIEKLMF